MGCYFQSFSFLTTSATACLIFELFAFIIDAAGPSDGIGGGSFFQLRSTRRPTDSRAGIAERQFGDRHAVAALCDNDGRRQQKQRVRAALKKDDEL